MSRSGYSDDCDNLQLYRNSVDRAIAGKRGQSLLRDLIFALDALPEKKLIAGDFITREGVCALGSVAVLKRLDADTLSRAARNEDHEFVAKAFNVAPSLAREVQYMNDEYWEDCTEEQRWERMRKWAAENQRAAPEKETK